METTIDKQQLLNERMTETSFTTALFKAYRQTYNQGEEIQISIPPSRQFVNLGDLTLYFRPLVKYQQDGDLTKFQNAQRCLTAINAANHLTISSITLNNNEILCQPRQNNQFARTVLDQYMKCFLKTKPVKGLSSDGVQLTTNYMIQSSSAMNAYNVLENQICVPANGIFTHPSMYKANEEAKVGNSAGLYVQRKKDAHDRGQNSSNFEGSYKPRAIVSQLYNYYYNCNLPPDDNKSTFGCSYYEQYSGVNLGNPRIEEVKADGTDPDGRLGRTSILPNNLDNARFPNLARCITPSISLYKRQQESFMAYRQRFIQIHVTPYEEPSISYKLGSKTLMPDQSQGYINIAASAANKGFSNLVNGPDGYSGYETFIKTRAIDDANAENLRAMPAKLVDCRFSYGIPVQQQSDSVYSRYEGKIWSDSDTTLLNQERYTTVAVKLSEISPELEQIGLICLEKTRVDISLFVNLPACCLSSYVQPSLILDSLNSAYSTPSKYVVDVAAAQNLGGSPQYYKKFIDLCQIGQGVSLTLNDLVMRIETHQYSQNAYQMVKEILNQPKPYTTFRMTTKQILGDGPMSIPLNLGVSTTLRCLLYWIIPRSNRFTAVQTKRSLETDNALAQDAMIEYSACQPPQRNDIRSTILDSYYIPHESFLTIDNEIYNKTQIPLQDPQLSQYLLSSSGLQTALSRYLDIDLQSFLHNRFIGVISVDPTGSRKFISQMLDFTINIDSKDRVNHAKTFNLHCRSINDQFDVVIAAVVGQSVVECQRVVV